MPDQKCTSTARIHIVMGSTSLLPIYATAVGFLYGLSAAGKSGDDVDINGLHTERKKEVGKMKEFFKESWRSASKFSKVALLLSCTSLVISLIKLFMR